MLGPESVQYLEVDADVIRNMSDGELRDFCSQYLGISTKPHWSRNQLITALVTASAGCSNKA